jgi:hypothetical protein
MQILHLFADSIQQYTEEISEPDRHRSDHCPQRAAQRPLTARGFYTRTVTDVASDGFIRVRRYLCHGCKRTVSPLPEFALPYLRFSILVISLFLVTRLLNGYTLQAAALLRELALSSGQNDPGVSASTLYRFLKQRGLTAAGRPLKNTSGAKVLRIFSLLLPLS